MTKQISVKVPDVIYDELSAYANMQGTNLTAFCRAAIRDTFFNAMLSDKKELERCQRMLSDADRYELSNREKADLEAKIGILTATTKRFEDTWADLAAELYGEGGEYNA
mgnify:CR=1 FL=1